MNRSCFYIFVFLLASFSGFSQVPVADFSASNDSVCVNDSIHFTDLSTNNPTAWTWSSIPSAGVSFNTSTTQSPFATFTAAGTYSVVLIAANVNGSDSDTMVVTIFPLPNVIASTAAGFNDSICFGDTTQLSASGALTYIWNMNEGLSDSAIFDPVFDSTITSTYIVVGTDANGCKNSSSITIKVLSLPNVTATSPVAICSGNSAMLNASGASTYVWNTSQFLNDSLIANPVCTPTAAVNYTVTGSTVFGCKDTSVVNVTVNPSAVAAGSVGAIGFGVPAAVNFTSTSSGKDSVVWNFGDNSATDTTTNPTHTYNAAGTYSVTLIAYISTGCNDTITFILTVQDKSSMVVPNFFTPNYDDANDVWRPITTGMKDFYCAIYDRWGLLMFEWDRYNGWWDGHTTSGIACPVGVYYYIIKATGTDGTEFNEKGYLHLFR